MDIKKFKKPIWLYKSKDVYKCVEKDSIEYKKLIKEGWVKNRAKAGVKKRGKK